jgi:hypothetical protein
MTLHRLALVSALAAGLVGPSAATSHTERQHDGLVWILKENCQRGEPRFSGRFTKDAPEKVTVVADFDVDMKTTTRKVNEKGRFSVAWPDVPERVRVRWRDRHGDVHSTGWRGPFHNGCDERGPEPPPGIPDDWIPAFAAPPGHTTCGDDSGVPCILVGWVPPPVGR